MYKSTLLVTHLILNQTFPGIKVWAGVHAIDRNISDRAWYADIVNYLANDVKPDSFHGYIKIKFMQKIQRYYWDEPYLYKHCSGGIYRRCVAETEVPNILFHCHGSDYTEHLATFKTVSKILQAGFWWPTMFCDAHAYIAQCDKCQREKKSTKDTKWNITSS